MSKLITSFGSISPHQKDVLMPLDFSKGWDQGPIFDWYKSLKDQAKSIETIQIWIQINKPVPHRFVVLHMSNGQIHRFDRRPDRSPGVDTNTISLLSNQAVACEDSFVRDVRLAEVQHIAEREVELKLKSKVDIIKVISACYAMHTDKNTREYSFLRYNCFFFSWTILMVISRCDQPYEVPEAALVVARFSATLEQITTLIVDDAVTLFLDMVVETITILRNKAGTSLNPGMSAAGRLVWRLPIGVLRFFWRRLFNARLHFGLRAQLINIAQSKIMEVASDVQEALLNRMVQDELNEHLWIEDMGPRIKGVLEEETVKLLWRAIIESISSDGFGAMSAEEMSKQIEKPSFKFSLLGKNVRQFCVISAAALHGGLQAANAVSNGLGTDHKDAFNQAWNAASQGALVAAKIVAENTNKLLHSKPERIAMYEKIWEIWGACWEEARESARPKSVQTVEDLVERLIKSGADAILQELKSCGTTVNANVTKKSWEWKRSRLRPNQFDGMTTSKLQESMHNIIKKSTINATTLKEVHISMGHVWTAVCKREIDPLVLDTIPETIPELS